jgi:hypothetical protein
MFHQVCRAIEPKLSLRATLERWPGLAESLAEGRRNRKLQNFE